MSLKKRLTDAAGVAATCFQKLTNLDIDQSRLLEMKTLKTVTITTQVKLLSRKMPATPATPSPRAEGVPSRAHIEALHEPKVFAPETP